MIGSTGGAVHGHELAVAQWAAWREQRREWADNRGVAESDLPMIGDEPWSDDMIGPIDPAVNEVQYWPDGSVARISCKPGV
jgi:hypothetical protein